MSMRHMLLIFWMLTGSVMADELATPTGEILLTITGNIDITNSERGAEFDLEMLEKLGATSLETETPWTDARTSFKGVRLSVLLKTVGAMSSTFRAVAVDNYWYDVGEVDYEKYPVIIAYQRDDKYMSARNLGPLWIMFPFSDFPELLTEKNKASSVWQLNSLVIK